MKAAGAIAAAILTMSAGPVRGAEATCDENAYQPARIACYLAAAEAAREPAVCEGAEDPVVRFQCLSLFAERSLDPGPCARIEMGAQDTPALRDACVAGVAIAGRDPALCAQVSRAEIRDSCYMMLVVERGAGPALCGRIENATLAAACRD